MAAIMEECARFAEQELSPIYQSGDNEGCRLEMAKCLRPKAIKKPMINTWRAAGKDSVIRGVRRSGAAGFAGVVKPEMISTANWSWGCTRPESWRHEHRPSARYRRTEADVPHQTDGRRWAGTMCLDGSPVARISARLRPGRTQCRWLIQADWQQDFISAGDHDLTENIIHCSGTLA